MARILIIDDSKVARLMSRAAIESMGHEVVEADSGETGLEIARRETLDCILLDLLMPGLSGRETLQQLRQTDAKTPVIIVTADDDPSVVEECSALGATSVMSKPRDPDELITALKEVLPHEQP